METVFTCENILSHIWEFKSYYVVWKQSGVFHIFFQNKRLNRTM